MSTDTPHLSLVVPVLDGASYIGPNLRTILDTLESELGRSFELIVVSDGSRDQTADIARAIDHPAVHVFHYPQNQGKGFAVSLGIAQARGQLVGWLDSDLEIEPEVIVRASRVLDAEPVDAVIGSKRHPDSQVYYPPIRRAYSWGYQTLIRLLFRLRVRDTQVGAKLFRRQVTDAVLPLLLIKRYAFDLEVLAVAAGFGFDRVREVPVSLHHRFTSSEIDWRAVVYMLTDTLAIAYRIHLRHWYVHRWATLQREHADQPPGEVPLPPALTAKR
jgi:glycosyltransferase involved in cell wall biosynthesis